MRARPTLTAFGLLAVPIAVVGLGACRPVDTATPTVTPSTLLPIPASLIPLPSFSLPKRQALPSPLTEAEKRRDVEITACTLDPHTHWPSADVRITNHDTMAVGYIVNIDFVDESGAKLADGVTAAQNVPPGASVPEKARGLVDVQGKQVTCKLVDVMRTPTF